MKITVFMVNFAGGGAERAAVMLANGLADRGHRVVLAVVSDSGPHRALVQENVHVQDLRAGRAYRSLFRLIAFLRREKPQVLLSYMILANTLAALASLALPGLTVIGVEQGSMHNGYRRDGRHLFQRLAYLAASWTYRRLNLLVCVDDSAALAARAFIRRPDLPVKVMPNAVIDGAARLRLSAPSGHAGLDGWDRPVFITVGRLTHQKNHARLLEAFARVRRKQSCRLIVLGEGELRASLEALAESLGIADSVAFPGFADNPFAWLAKADVFVLSSRWEGLPTVLIEAAFAGLPIVSTKASAGTMELTGYGRFGQLVEEASPVALAEAMQAVLTSPPPPTLLEAAARRYEIGTVAAAYERLFRDIDPRLSEAEPERPKAAPLDLSIFRRHRFSLLGVPVDPLEADEILAAVTGAVESGTAITLCHINLHGLYCAQHSAAMAGLLQDPQSLVHVDGMPIVWLGRLKGLRLAAAVRNTHLDLLPTIIRHCAARGWPIGFIGSSPAFLDDNRRALEALAPGGTFAVEHGFLSGDAEAEASHVIGAMNDAGCRFVLVGMGMPVQETWIAAHRHRLSAPVVMPVGGFIDYIAGRTPQPPRVLGRLGLEGIYRLVRNPRRLAFRYGVEPLLLLGIALRRALTPRGRRP